METTFDNQRMDTAELPKLTELQLVQLSATYRFANRLTTLLFVMIIQLLIFATIHQSVFDFDSSVTNLLRYAMLVLVAMGALRYAYQWFADPLKSYALREHDLSYSAGLFFKRVVTQPILRIQHIELKRGPIERKFGLATLQVFSAGGTIHTFEIPGLELKKAKQIREFILTHKDVSA